MGTARRALTARWPALLAAVAVPVAVTAVLVPLGSGSRDYVFIYLGVVAVLGALGGAAPAAVAAVLGFLLVDFFFVPPLHALTIGDATDIVNLAAFAASAAIVGGLGSVRRRSLHRAELLAQQLSAANVELARLNRDQAEAAAMAVRLARSEQEVHALEQTDRLRGELLANVSHELRTPLASILTGTTDLLETPGLTPRVAHGLGTVTAETRRLAQLVADMLDLARIEGHALRIEPTEVSLRDAVDASLTRLRALAPSREVEVDVDRALEVLADWSRVGQVLDNLLSNADRFSPAGTPIRVEAAEGRRGMVVVRVIDHGPGIPAGERPHVFERFVHGGSGGGTGLGLSIVRGIVEAHAGRAWLEDPRDGEGSRFAFTLPSARPSAGDVLPGAVAGEDVDVDVDKQAHQPAQ